MPLRDASVADDGLSLYAIMLTIPNPFIFDPEYFILILSICFALTASQKAGL